jgi:serine phosphatase RsbU (regulator of sigma subunit)
MSDTMDSGGAAAVAAELADLRHRLEQQSKLVEANHALHTTFDLDELLGLILRVAAEGVGADRGTVFLFSEDRKEIWSRVSSGAERMTIRLPVGKGISGAVAESLTTINIADAYEDARFDQSWDKKSGYRTRQILCAPIRNREGVAVGVFQLLNKQTGGDFNAGDEEYLASLSIGVSLALENARLHSSALEKERYDREVALAQGVQRQIQPEKRRLGSGVLTVAGMNELCEDASGDYYDLLVDLPGDRVGVAVGDVSGHGLQAALVMVEARALLRAFLRTTDDLVHALRLVNDFLVPDMRTGSFISLFTAVVDAKTGVVAWCNGGHNPPYLYCARDNSVRPLDATGRILGILEGAPCRAGAPFTLEVGDVILLYTDGVTEARDPTGELFEDERLQESLRRAAAAPDAAAVLNAIRADLATYTAGVRSEDDVTMLAVKRVR